ncbi:hypothetical protein N657DRAFT_650781 [Parathielavia appendiculata]|uniref:Uncharacterized protein n=1 Tax=Parathielavia appendiculata TaxID=2587402 RepID=A0AAN6TQP0_9PEZI|nr:hypothetical protein N657DRAFT_650781 [Parathielavia appendiculata]
MTDREVEAQSSQPTPTSSDSPFVRLHVTPLDPELLKVVLSLALLPKARNISYHAIETFPEKRYGFLDLPIEDAEKLRKKLNGSVLKGVKIRIDRARPSRILTPLGQAAMAEEKTSKKTTEGAPPPKDKSKKRKRGAEELSGVILEDGRKIKRGWTSADEPKEKWSKQDKERKKGKNRKKQVKSKYTDHAECLVKTVLPANAAPSPDPMTERKKKKRESREVVVHEFERTTKFPTFLKAAAPPAPSAAPLEFVDGKGWVNQDGVVVESVKSRPPLSCKALLSSGSKKDRVQETVLEEGTVTSSSDSEDEAAGESESEAPATAGKSSPLPEFAASGSSSPTPPAESDPPRPRSSALTRNLSIKIPPTTPNEAKVHPLEALYKRPKQPDDGIPTAEAGGGQGFNFFADGNEDSAGEGDVDADVNDGPSGMQVPLTPFTRHDLELRGIRSAAPTPDTAHPNRKFTPWEPDNEDDVERQDTEPAYQDFEEEDEQGPLRTTTTQAGEGRERTTSDFHQWFFENRGDVNRSWRKRRKIAGKEKRYRENKARMARAI